MEILLSIRNLTKYKKKRVLSFKKDNNKILDSIYLNIYKNEVISLLGETLSGKSTLGKAILKLVPIDKGKILYDNQDITDFNNKKMKSIRKEMQILFQHSQKFINPRISIFEVITEALINSKLSKDEINIRVYDILEIVGLSKNILNKLSIELTATELEKIMLAKVLILKPKFLIVDEPTSNLNSKDKYRIVSLLKKVKKSSNITILLISTDPKVVISMADRIAIIYKGQIIEILTPKDFIETPLHPYTKLLSQDINIEDIDKKNSSYKKDRCQFLDRCSLVKDRCYLEKPKLKEYINDHHIACFLYEKKI